MGGSGKSFAAERGKRDEIIVIHIIFNPLSLSFRPHPCLPHSHTNNFCSFPSWCSTYFFIIYLPRGWDFAASNSDVSFLNLSTWTQLMPVCVYVLTWDRKLPSINRIGIDYSPRRFVPLSWQKKQESFIKICQTSWALLNYDLLSIEPQKPSLKLGQSDFLLYYGCCWIQKVWNEFKVCFSL